MRRCQRIGCENSLDHHRADARYCGATCKREAARSANLSDGSAAPGFWDRYAQLRRRRRRTVALATLTALLVYALAGCGGHAAVKLLKTSAGHPCNPQDYVQGCVHPATGPAKLRLGAAAVAQGVDFAWGGPSCSTLKAQGRSFGASYLSYDGSKNFSHAQFSEYLAHGCKVVLVWETSANRAGAGYSAGQSDAREALRQYRTYIPSGRVAITFAIDFDANIGQIASYFQGADSVLGVQAVNAYGGYYPLRDLCARHLVGSLNWQTYAWSGGNWLPASCAPLEQYLNDGQVDYDRAIAADYGQWPPPGPPPDPYAIFQDVTYDLGHGIKADEKTIVKGWNDRHCLNPTRRPVCGFLHYRLELLDSRLRAVANRSHPADWSTGHRYRRAKYIEHELAQTRGPWQP